VNRNWRRVLVLSAVSLALAAGCEDRDPTELDVGRLSTDPVVFEDSYGEGVYFQPFFETHYLAASVDSVFAVDLTRPGGLGFAPDGARSWKVEIPAIGSALGPYSGGVLTPAVGRDLADYNALTFWVRTDVDGIMLDVAGFGNDNTGTSGYEASRKVPSTLLGAPVHREWTYRIVPIPDASRLINERGLFLFGESAEGEAIFDPESGETINLYPDGYNIWFDQIEFAHVDGIELFTTRFSGSAERRYFVGQTVTLGGVFSAYTYPLEEENIIVNHSSRYYELASSNNAVAVPTPTSQVRIVGTGQAEITGKLGDVDAVGKVRLASYEPPASGPAAPTLSSDRVISMFSDAYDDVPVKFWLTDWSPAQYQEWAVAGDNVKVYYDVTNYFGIDLNNYTIDASDMTHLHLDVYAPVGASLTVKVKGRTGDEEPSVSLDAASIPAYVPGEWSSLDIPLESFNTSASWSWSNIGLLIIECSPGAQLLLVDNLYWHR
jgi:hypothetical protein